MPRALIALFLLVLAAPLGAQTATTVATPTPAAQPRAGAPVLPDSIRDRIALVRADAHAASFALDSVTVGDRTVRATERVPGSVAIVRGDLNVYGVIDGDAVAIDGDVVVHPGGRVHGDAFAAFGEVRLAGGYVQGETRSLQGNVVALPRSVIPKAAPALSPWDATRRALGIALGWLAVLLGIGIAAFMFAGSYLEAVAETIERRFSRAFWVGVLGQLGLLPALLIVVVGLAITVIGLLLIPFAVVAFAMAAAGVITLGALAVAQVIGRSVLRQRIEALSPRGAALKALMTGLVLFVGLWILAAAVIAVPVVSFVAGAIAFVVTWVAATVGLGAVLISRGGTRRVEAAAPATPPRETMSWQTPTPVTGVVAARRPTPAPPTP